MTEPTRLDVFKQAVAAIFTQWTLLNLAVHNGWGGKGAHKKQEQLYEWVIDAFQRGGNRITAERLATELACRVENLFHVIVEDNSDIEVAELLIKLAGSTSRGDFEVANQILQQNTQSTAAKLASKQHDDSNGSSDDSDSEDLTAETQLQEMFETSNLNPQNILSDLHATPSGLNTRTSTTITSAAGTTPNSDGVSSQNPGVPEALCTDPCTGKAMNTEADGWTCVQQGRRKVQ